MQTPSEHANSSGRNLVVPVSPLRPVKMVKLVQRKIAKARKEQSNPPVLRSSSQSGTRPSVPALYLMTSEIWGIPPRAPRVQIALIACCILILLQMKRSRAAWCLTADNRLGRRGEGPCGGK